MAATIVVRRAEPLREVCSALGGVEADARGARRYIKGAECLECLYDIHNALKKDGPKRGILRQLGHWRVLQTDLVPLLVTYAADPTLSFAVSKVICALTMPLSIQFPNGTDRDEANAGEVCEVTEFLRQYKRALATTPVVAAFMALLAPALEKDATARTEQDTKLLELVLTQLRNMLLLPDPRGDPQHGNIAVAFRDANVMDLLIVLASGVKDDDGRQWTMLLLEMTHLLLHRYEPKSIANALLAPAESNSRRAAAAKALKEAATAEAELRRRKALSAPRSRHSRFGGTFVLQSEAESCGERVLHKAPGAIAAVTQDEGKLARARRVPKGAVDPLAKVRARDDVAVDPTSDGRHEVLLVLGEFASHFIESCYNPVMEVMRAEIDSNLRTVGTDEANYLWAMGYFMQLNRLLIRRPEEIAHRVSLIAQSLELSTSQKLVRTLTYAREAAREDKSDARRGHVARMVAAVPAYREQLEYVVVMADSRDDSLCTYADNLQANLFYDYAALAVVPQMLREYDPHIQDAAFLGSLTRTAHLLIKLLERYSASRSRVFVQKKRKVRQQKKKKRPAAPEANAGGELGEGAPEGDADVDGGEGGDAGEEDEDEDDDDAPSRPVTVLVENELNLGMFVRSFSNSAVVRTLLRVLERFVDNDAGLNHAAVRLLHRIAVDCGLDNLFHALDIFQSLNAILSNEAARTNPRLQEVRTFAKYIVSQFFKRAEDDPSAFLFLALGRARPTPGAVGTSAHGAASGSAGGRAKNRSAWDAEEESLLVKRFAQHREAGAEDPVALLMEELARPRRQIRAKLLELRAVESAKELKPKRPRRKTAKGTEPEDDGGAGLLRQQSRRGVRRSTKTHWTAAEDARLRELVDEYDGLDETPYLISKDMEGKSPEEVEARIVELGLLRDVRESDEGDSFDVDQRRRDMLMQRLEEEEARIAQTARREGDSGESSESESTSESDENSEDDENSGAKDDARAIARRVLRAKYEVAARASAAAGEQPGVSAELALPNAAGRSAEPAVPDAGRSAELTLPQSMEWAPAEAAEDDVDEFAAAARERREAMRRERLRNDAIQAAQAQSPSSSRRFARRQAPASDSDEPSGAARPRKRARKVLSDASSESENER